MMLTQNFSLEELFRSEWAERHGVDNTPPSGVIGRLRNLAEHLERVRALLGGAPIIVSSGYRSPAVNAGIGSKAKHSAHLDGDAADFIAPKFGTPIEVCREISNSVIMFDQLIHEHTWAHLSLAPALRRQLLTLRSDGGYDLGIQERGR
jgi:hypothetical protein